MAKLTILISVVDADPGSRSGNRNSELQFEIWFRTRSLIFNIHSEKLKSKKPVQYFIIVSVIISYLFEWPQ
jgi:hypothetical protein